jgi:hypothetical protein
LAGFEEETAMRIAFVLFAAAGLMACSRDKSYESGGTTDTTADTTVRSRIPDIDVRMKTDTVTVPTIGTVKDTIIVSKPVKTGEKQVEIKRPTVDVKRP